MSVPYFDLSRAARRIAPRLEERWSRVVEATSFVLGPEVHELEQGFAAFVGGAGCVAVGNGTDALVLALRALDLGAGDEVIVPAFSFFATPEAVSLAGGVPVFADIDPETLNLDPADVERRVGERTVGVLGVHLYGRPFDADRIGAVCERHGLWLVEDAAQAHGATWNGRPAGTLGRLAAWSFYPTKNLGCYGDGGAVTGPDAELLARVRLLANHGQARRYHHLLVGTNSRLDSLQAAVLNCRLPDLAADNGRRRAIAAAYRQRLDGVGDLAFPVDPQQAECVYHQFAVRTGRRDGLLAHLADRGVGSSIHYPEPLNRQPAYSDHPQAGERLAASEAAAVELLCLPCYPELTDDEVDEVSRAVIRFFGG